MSKCEHDIQIVLENPNDLESIELICIKCKRVFKDENEVLFEGKLLGLQEAVDIHKRTCPLCEEVSLGEGESCSQVEELKSAMKKVKE